MAPDVTSFLQEPDTHEHSQLKAEIREVKSEMHWALEQEWVQKVKEEPEKNYKYPSTWGPYECLYCVSEAYRRFCEKHKEAVPLQGFQANQMLVVRPDEEGKLVKVTGDEPWSWSTEPGRGIEPNLAKQRHLRIDNWPEGGEPPVPDWSMLDGDCFNVNDLPKDYEDDENPCLLEIQKLNLELTPDQEYMLRPPEDRIKEIQFEKALEGRTKKDRRVTRKNRWGAKFSNQWLGKLQRRWIQKKRETGGQDELESKSRGVVVVVVVSSSSSSSS